MFISFWLQVFFTADPFSLLGLYFLSNTTFLFFLKLVITLCFHLFSFPRTHQWFFPAWLGSCCTCALGLALLCIGPCSHAGPPPWAWWGSIIKRHQHICTERGPLVWKGESHWCGLPPEAWAERAGVLTHPGPSCPLLVDPAALVLGLWGGLAPSECLVPLGPQRFRVWKECCSSFWILVFSEWRKHFFLSFFGHFKKI